jgi:predicted amidohydrolase
MPDVEQNLVTINRELTALCADVGSGNVLDNGDEHIVVLPECCLFFGGKEEQQLTLARQTLETDYLLKALSALADKFNITLVAGTIPVLTPCGEKFTNSCCVFSAQGELIGRYDKIHLFDVNVGDSEKNYLESQYTQAGDAIELVKHHELNMGLSVCYDIRFPALYRQLTTQGATVITVPSAFTRVTGNVHWQALLQARAIENQVYIIAAGQEGTHANGRETWGHSMIISPWGDILAVRERGEGYITGYYCQEKINRVRAAMPVNEHNKFTVELKSYE